MLGKLAVALENACAWKVGSCIGKCLCLESGKLHWKVLCMHAI